MKIDWLEYDKKEHVIAWFLVEAMAKADIKKFGNFNSSKIDAELKINGIEVDFVEVFEHLQSQLDDIRKDGKQDGIREASYVIKDNIDKLLNGIEEIEIDS